MKVRSTRIEAFKWFQLAAQQGYWKAANSLERVNLQMNKVEVTEGLRRAASFVAKEEPPPNPKPSTLLER